MLFIGQNLKDVHMIFFSWIFDLLLSNSKYLVFEVSEAIVQRGSRPEVFCTKGVLKNFAKFTGKHLSQSLFFNKVDLRPATLFKDRLRHRCFPKFCEIFENTFSTEHLQWLLLKFISHHTKKILYVNANLIGNQPWSKWSKNKHFLLFLILMLKQPFKCEIKTP